MNNREFTREEATQLWNSIIAYSEASARRYAGRDLLTPFRYSTNPRQKAVRDVHEEALETLRDNFSVATGWCPVYMEALKGKENTSGWTLWPNPED